MALSDFFGGGSESYGISKVDPAQQPFLDFLRNTGLGLAQQGIGPAQAFGRQQGSQLFGQGQDFLDTLSSNPFLSALQQQAGGNRALIDRQVNQLGADIGRQFNQQILPGIRRDATAFGALGGSRQGVAEGIASQGAADALSRGITDIYSADAQRSLQAGISGGGLAAQGALGGLSALPGLFNVGLGQFTGGFAPLSLFNSIVGPPTVLNEQQSRSSGGLFGSIDLF